MISIQAVDTKESTFTHGSIVTEVFIFLGSP